MKYEKIFGRSQKPSINARRQWCRFKKILKKGRTFEEDQTTKKSTKTSTAKKSSAASRVAPSKGGKKEAPEGAKISGGARAAPPEAGHVQNAPANGGHQTQIWLRL